MYRLILAFTFMTVLLSCGRFEHSDNDSPQDVSDAELTMFGLMRVDNAPASPVLPTLNYTVPKSALTSVSGELTQTQWIFTISATHDNTNYVQTMKVAHVFSEVDLTDVTELENEMDIFTQKGFFIRWRSGSSSITAKISYNIGSVITTNYTIDLTKFRLDGDTDTPIDEPPTDDPVETPVSQPPPVVSNPTPAPPVFVNTNRHQHTSIHSHFIDENEVYVLERDTGGFTQIEGDIYSKDGFTYQKINAPRSYRDTFHLNGTRARYVMARLGTTSEEHTHSFSHSHTINDSNDNGRHDDEPDFDSHVDPDAEFEHNNAGGSHNHEHKPELGLSSNWVVDFRGDATPRFGHKWSSTYIIQHDHFNSNGETISHTH